MKREDFSATGRYWWWPKLAFVLVCWGVAGTFAAINVGWIPCAPCAAGPP